MTADDFGLAPEVNDAVESAHRYGILTAASLMVGASASKDAVARTKRMPKLRVGLHLALAGARPVLPAADIPDLVDESGLLRSNLVALGLAIAARRSVQHQVRAEIRAQFEAYRATGLTLDHVNVHLHYHLHPLVLREILAIGVEYGMRGLRVPIEPIEILRSVEPTSRHAMAMLTAPLAAMMRRRVRKAGFVSADQVFGLAWSGAMTEDRIAGLIENLPHGRTEIYTHPATSGGYEGAVRDYCYAKELAALLSSRCREAVRRSAAIVGGYADLMGAP